MINIISPKSVYVNNDDPSTYTLNWEGSLPDGQVSYEILYREKGSDTWLTSGKVVSTATEYDLRNIYSQLNIDFVEIEYKVNVTYEKSENDETIKGTESSNTFSLIFNQGITADLNVWVNSEKRSYPMFDEIRNDNMNIMSVHTPNGNKLLPLVDDDNVLSSDMRIQVADDKIQSVARYDPDFKYYTPTDADVFGTINVEGQYNYSYQRSYNYISTYGYNYSYYDSTSSDVYCSYESGYVYYNYLVSSVRNTLRDTTSFISAYSYRYSYTRSDNMYGYRYYSYLRSYANVQHSDSYYYIPTQLVKSVYAAYGYGYSYQYYMGGAQYSATAYATYYTYATGVYQTYVQISSQGSSTAGRGYGYATHALAYLVYYAYTSGTYYYYQSSPVYAYDKSQFYSYVLRTTAYAYTATRYSYKYYTYYTYTNTYAYDRGYSYEYYHYNNIYYWNNYAYAYSGDTYSYNYETITDKKSYNYTYYC